MLKVLCFVLFSLMSHFGVLPDVNDPDTSRLLADQLKAPASLTRNSLGENTLVSFFLFQ